MGVSVEGEVEDITKTEKIETIDPFAGGNDNVIDQ
jgi:hypothetical protein